MTVRHSGYAEHHAESGRLERHGRSRALVSSEARSLIGSLSILSYEPSSPGQLVLNPLPVRLGGRPKFKILNPVVITLTVLVVHPLVRKQWAPEVVGHHYSMLKYLFAVDQLDYVAVLGGVPG
jgi:hypothetical protein